MDKDLILQVSIPFCFKRCAYCAYPYCAYDPGVVRAYVEALLREIDSAASEMEEYQVTAVSLEGGSPVLATPDGLDRILRRIKKSFRCADDLQISLQTMPGDYSRALMEKMRDAGVNHWIIGLQTAQMAEHEALERPYKFDAITMVDMALRTFRPRDISFDLLYGIPHQTPHSWRQTLERVLSYSPAHLSVYPLRIEPGTRLAEESRTNPIEQGGTKDSADTSPEYYEIAAWVAKAKGMKPYTIYDFARPGHENKFRLGELNGTDRLGLGYHATTLLGDVTYRNGHSLQEYIEHADDLSVIANGMVRLDETGLAALREAREALQVSEN